MDKSYLEGVKVKGSIYAIPTLRDMASSSAVVLCKDLVDKYNIDVSKFHTLADLEGPLKAVKAGEPDLAPLIRGTIGASILSNYQTYDSLVDGIGVLPNYDNNLKVVNRYETEEYAQQVKMLRKWYQEGLILKDAVTNKNTQTDLIGRGEAAE